MGIVWLWSNYGNLIRWCQYKTLLTTQYLHKRCGSAENYFRVVGEVGNKRFTEMVPDQNIWHHYKQRKSCSSVTWTHPTPRLVPAAPWGNRPPTTGRDIPWQRIWDPHCSVVRNMSALRWPRASHETCFLSVSLNRPTLHRIVPA